LQIKIVFNKEGDSFGEISFFTGNFRVASAQSKDFTTLCSLKRVDFLEILFENPDDYEKYCMILDQIKFENNYNALSIKCFSCDQKGHLANQCPLIHYIPDVEKAVKVYTFNPSQKERYNILRNPAKTFNALFSKNEINGSFQRFQRLLRQLYVMENDTFMQDSDKNSMDSSDSPETKEAEISPIEVSSKIESQFKLQICNLKEDSLITENENDDNTFNEFEKVNNAKSKPENIGIDTITNGYVDNSNLISKKENNNYNKISEFKQNLKELDSLNKKFLSLPENKEYSIEVLNRRGRSPSENYSPNNKRNDLTINTESSRSAVIKYHARKKFSHDLKLNEILEVNSVTNSLPEKTGRQNPKNEESFNFIRAENDNASFDFPEVNFEKEFFETRKFEGGSFNILEKPQQMDNFLSRPENFEECKERHILNFQLSKSDNRLDFIEPFEQKVFSDSNVMDETNNPSNNKKIEISGSPPELNHVKIGSFASNSSKGEHSKSIFRYKRKKSKTKSTVPVPLTSPITVLKRKKSVTELFNSPLLKLPIYNMESPGMMKNRTSSKKEKKNTEENTTITSSKDLKMKEKMNESFILNEDLEFDRVSNFKNYYPQNNVKSIINKISNVKKKKSHENLIKRQPKKRGATKMFKSYFEKNPLIITPDPEKPFKSNQVVPLMSPVDSQLKRSSTPKIPTSEKKLSPEGGHHKRPSSIFTSNVGNKNFFQHESNEVTFYDVVYEVLTNKDLRKRLMLEKMKSNKKKSCRKEDIH